MSNLVERLSKGNHAVSMMRYKTYEELYEAISRGFVLVKFTETQGGTEVGFKLDLEKSHIDHENASGKLQLVGQFTLDYIPVECNVDIDTQSLEGTGKLTPLNAEHKSPIKKQATTKKGNATKKKITTKKKVTIH